MSPHDMHMQTQRGGRAIAPTPLHSGMQAVAVLGTFFSSRNVVRATEHVSSVGLLNYALFMYLCTSSECNTFHNPTAELQFLTALPDTFLRSCLIMGWKLSFSLSLFVDNDHQHLSTLWFCISPTSCYADFFFTCRYSSGFRSCCSHCRLHIINLFTRFTSSRTFSATTCIPSSLHLIINLVNSTFTVYVVTNCKGVYHFLNYITIDSSLYMLPTVAW